MQDLDEEKTETNQEEEVNLASEYAKAAEGGEAEANEQERPEGAAEAEKPKEEAPPPKERFSALRRHEKKLREKSERIFAERERVLAERERKLEAEARELEQLRRIREEKSMKRRAELAGIDIEKLADEFRDRTAADDARDAAAAELQRLRNEEGASKKQQEEAESKQREQARQREEMQYLREAASHDDIVEMVRSGEWDDTDVLKKSYDIGRRLQQEKGRIPTNKEILDELGVRASRFLGKQQAANGQRANPVSEQVTAKPGNRASRTLTGKQGITTADPADDFDPHDKASVSRFLARAARS